MLNTRHTYDQINQIQIFGENSNLKFHKCFKTSRFKYFIQS